MEEEFESSEEFGIEQAAEKIVFGLNIGYGFFLTALSLFGFLVIGLLAIISVALGLVLFLISWIFLKPVKKEGWFYAFIINIMSIIASYLLMPFPVVVFPITFAILIIIIMIIPPIRKPFT
jgi:hypothetical protein